jgi:hypothetical protein
MPRTLSEIRRDGLGALRRELGRAGLARFMQLFSGGQGDYAKERKEWVDATSLADLKELAASKPPSSSRKKKRSQKGS